MVKVCVVQSLKEALKIKSEHKAILYSGQMDYANGSKEDIMYICLNEIPQMRQITADDEYVRIGASCTFSQALESRYVPEIMKAPFYKMTKEQIESMGTFGSDITNAYNKADSILIEYVADSKLVIDSLNGSRITDISDFYLENRQIDLADDEIITQVLMPRKGLYNYYYRKQKPTSLSKISLAGVIKTNDDIIQNIAVAFSSIEKKIFRSRDIECMLEGKSLKEAKDMKKDFLEAYRESINPIRDKISGEYRKSVCVSLLDSFLVSKGI